MAIVALETSVRTGTGKGPARQARMAGNVPAVLYGLGQNPVMLTINAKRFDQVLAHGRGNLIIEIDLGEGEKLTTIVRDLQRDPISSRVLHVDFQRISLTDTIHRAIPVRLVGIAIGVKDYGGVMDFPNREVEVEGLPTAIPSAIEFDVTALMVGDVVHARDLKIEGVTMLTDPGLVILHVVPPTASAAAAEGPAAAKEPDVVGKKKTEE